MIVFLIVMQAWSDFESNRFSWWNY